MWCLGSFILLFLLVVLCFACAAGCRTLPSAEKDLPTGSTEVTDVGNGWCTFKWQGRKFLARRLGTQSALVTEIKEQP